MNAPLKPNALKGEFLSETRSTFPMALFAPDLDTASCTQFPLSGIAAEIGIQDVDAITMEQVMSRKIQSLNSTFAILQADAFQGLNDTNYKRMPMSLEFEKKGVHVDQTKLRVKASNEETYFCANLKIIRQAVARLGNVIHGDVEEFSRAIQQALVSSALQSGKPVIFLDSMIEDADKVMLSKGDRYIRQNQIMDQDSERNALARKF